ncbi:hypothetical protein BDZ85DRAFT_29910 [Elsinoe ampelina]|uniref:F-box domain-containing protein n=1 Tax=Elsinoe ampelina TaxID=302913 RepID=A0A6A6G5K8_9PEZI|nr:hypothetical protein BDZ85DRAFT_29910 [Elsinoe ampelina]
MWRWLDPVHRVCISRHAIKREGVECASWRGKDKERPAGLRQRRMAVQQNTDHCDRRHMTRTPARESRAQNTKANVTSSAIAMPSADLATGEQSAKRARRVKSITKPTRTSPRFTKKSSATKNDASTLVNLPLEIRRMIFGHVLPAYESSSATDPVELSRRDQVRCYLYIHAGYKKLELAFPPGSLAHSNRQLRAEILDFCTPALHITGLVYPIDFRRVNRWIAYNLPSKHLSLTSASVMLHNGAHREGGWRVICTNPKLKFHATINASNAVSVLGKAEPPYAHKIMSSFAFLRRRYRPLRPHAQAVAEELAVRGQACYLNAMNAAVQSAVARAPPKEHRLSDDAILAILDILGREVGITIDEGPPAGQYEQWWIALHMPISSW